MAREIEKADPRPIEQGLSVNDRLSLQEAELREQISKKITRTFILVNGAVLFLVLLAMLLDHYFIAKKHIAGADRLITTNVLITIVGATTVQLGAIAFAMSNWLFPKKAPPSEGA